MSLQLTSGSGGQTFHEAALRLNQEVENLTLLSYSYSITGISKPVDKVGCTKQMHLKLSANLIIRGGENMPKTNKELAIDVAVAYIYASGNAKTANGASTGPYNLEQIEQVIKHVYTALESLDNK